MGTLLRELLEGIIDYAGLFPPAKLPMADAVGCFLRYGAGREGWIVNRFLCPAARLEELGTLAEGKGPFSVGVIGTGGKDYDAFQTALEADARAMTTFEDRWSDSIEIECFEVRMPRGATVEAVAADLRGFDKAAVFLELPWGEDQSEGLAAIAEVDWLGAKARTGGTEAAAFPSTNQVAEFLRNCQDLDLRFKLTAGLHHPVPTLDEELGIRMHGFANILAAMALREAHDLSTAEMARALESDQIAWSDDHVEWEGMKAGRADVRAIRELFTGFGSCSVDEPLDDLKRLGLVSEVGS